MSRLKKEDLIKLKEQFKSIHNVLPSRFKDLDGEDINFKNTEKQRQGTLSAEPGTSKNNKELKKGLT